MNKNCIEYNCTQTVKDGEGWIMYLISFPFYGVRNTCVVEIENNYFINIIISILFVHYFPRTK